MNAKSPWQRRVCFLPPFLMRMFVLTLRCFGIGGGSNKILIHLVLQVTKHQFEVQVQKSIQLFFNDLNNWIIYLSGFTSCHWWYDRGTSSPRKVDARKNRYDAKFSQHNARNGGVSGLFDACGNRGGPRVDGRPFQLHSYRLRLTQSCGTVIQSQPELRSSLWFNLSDKTCHLERTCNAIHSNTAHN